MRHFHRRSSFVFSGLLVLVFCLVAPQAGAYPSFFESRCASCHADDSQSCDGCHEHRNSLSASTDHMTYDPGAIVNVTLEGGSRGGWVRGLLYDQNGTEIARVKIGDAALGRM